MKTRTGVQSCVLTLLESAIRERFRYPELDLNEDFVSKTARKLELIAFDYSQAFTDNVETSVVEGQTNFIITKSNRVPSEEESYDAYISNVATLVIHISPEFYTGRHSFIFRDRLVQGKLAMKLLEMDRGELWPEIFSNNYLTKVDLEMIELQREVERNIAVSGLETFIETCCGKNVCQYEERKNFLKGKSRIFHEGSPFTESLNYVCFGKGSTCWEKNSNKIVLPCDGSVCQTIPEAAKTLYNSTNGYKYFSTCMMYEDFLRAFAYKGIQGEVPDPTDPTKEINDFSLELIRKKYSKELKMMRFYLDMNLSE